MSLLQSVKKGKIETPHLILIYGPDGVGKTSFAGDAPDPIFLGTEKGTGFLDVARFTGINSFGKVRDAVRELSTEKHAFKTLVIDSLDWLEPLVWAEVCKQNQWESIESPAYGKGYALALDTWRDLIADISALYEKGLNVILIAHSQVRAVYDPALNEAYDRYELKLNAKAAGLMREFVNTVGFASFRVSALKEKGQQKAKIYGTGERVLYTERRPGFDAKNRQGLPYELALSWEAYANASKFHKRSADQVREAISALLKECEDKKIVDAVSKSVEIAGKNVAELSRIENKLKTRLGN